MRAVKVCPTCKGEGTINYFDGYDGGYGFPVESQGTCPHCRGVRPYRQIEAGDTVRFIYGHREWTVTGVTEMPSGRRSVRLSRCVKIFGNIARTAWDTDLRIRSEMEDDE